jgi:CheY-like chemotaxis protein
MRAALRGLLEDTDLPVIGEAADGLQAVTMAAQLQPDIVVMDVRMPRLDGLQATTRITGAYPNIRVVVYSVFDTDETRHAAHLAGAAAFVPKHDPPDHVRAAVLATWRAASTTTPTPPTAPLRDHPSSPGKLWFNPPPACGECREGDRRRARPRSWRWLGPLPAARARLRLLASDGVEDPLGVVLQFGLAVLQAAFGRCRGGGAEHVP